MINSRAVGTEHGNQFPRFFHAVYPPKVDRLYGTLNNYMNYNLPMLCPAGTIIFFYVTQL